MVMEKIILPDDHFQKRVNNQYSDVHLAIVREILQNSQDANASWVKITTTEHGFDATDNGCGMTLDEFRSFYLTLGGTKKETGSIGGFGAAKELLSFAWENWECQGQDFTVSGSGASDPESETDRTLVKGFRVSATDENLSGFEIHNKTEELLARSKLKVAVYVNGEKLSQGRALRKNQLVKTFDFGNLYVHKSDKNPDYHEATGYLVIRTRGLYTASEYVGGDYVWYLDLTAASPEVLTENRDSLRYNIKTEIQKCIAALNQRPDSIENRVDAKITIYGQFDIVDGDTTYSSEYGAFGVHSHSLNNLWRKPFAIVEDNTKANIIRDNALRPKYTKALEVWSRTLNLIANITGLEPPIPGLLFSKNANAVYHVVGNIASVRLGAVSAQTDLILKDTPFSILETAIHELAHYKRSNHSQEYETERMRIARLVGQSALSILHTIASLQSQPARRGRYWE